MIGQLIVCFFASLIWLMLGGLLFTLITDPYSAFEPNARQKIMIAILAGPLAWVLGPLLFIVKTIWDYLGKEKI